MTQFPVEWMAPLAILAAGAALGWLARPALGRLLGALTRRSATDLDDLALAVARTHVPIWFLLGGVSLAAQFAPIPPHLASLAGRLCSVALILSLSFAAARLGAGSLGRWADRSGGGLGRTSLIQNVLRLAILSFGALLVLSNLGVAITPLLTALGVGSLAVALALQPTLTNLFAGLHISLSRPIRVGDFVEMENGARGFVDDIGWRATRIRELPDNIIVIPNARVAEMIVTNYALPAPEQAALVQVGVAYGSDLDRVERVACAVARDTLRDTDGGVAEFEPFIRYHTFGDSAIQFTVILRVRSFTDRYLVTHEFIKRLRRRFAAEGIEIPFPQRVVHGPEGARASADGGGVAAARGGGAR
jgi:small-conductance mechanosensitive channel